MRDPLPSLERVVYHEPLDNDPSFSDIDLQLNDILDRFF